MRRERESATRNPMIGERTSLSGLFPFAIHGLASRRLAFPAARLHHLSVITAPPFWIRPDRARSALPMGNDTRRAIHDCDKIVPLFPMAWAMLIPILVTSGCSRSGHNTYPKNIIMKLKSTTLAIMAFSAIAAVTSQAAITYSVGSPYTQNFNGLSEVTTWTNDSTLPGWFAATTSTSSITAIGSNTGSTTTGGLYSFGVAGTNALTERSLGFAPSNAFTGASGSGIGALGLSFSHTAPTALTSFTLTYDGEQWRKELTVAHSLTVQYQITSSAITTANLVAAAGWITAGSGLTFNSPVITSGAAALDGNKSANRSAGLTATVSSISWASTQNLWVRFVDLNDSGNDQFQAIDNLTFSAVPEPSSALLGGLGLLALLRRRR